MLKKTYLILAAIVLIIIGIVGGLVFYQSNRKSGDQQISQELGKIKITYPPLASSLPTLLAYEKGFFRDEGLEVELVKATSPNTVIASLVAGEIHAQGPIGWASVIAAEAESPGTFKTYGFYYEEGEYYQTAFITKKDSGIENISDFKGKKIGTYQGATTYLWLKLILEANGLDPEKDVTIKQVDMPFQIEILSTDQVDILYANEPFVTIALGDENNILLEANPRKQIIDPAPGTPILLFTSQFQSENPETVEKIKRVYKKSIEESVSNEIESRKILTKYTSLNEEQAMKVRFYKPEVPISEEHIKDLQKFADILYENGTIQSPVDVTTFID